MLTIIAFLAACLLLTATASVSAATYEPVDGNKIII
jgi:hypothetical protein